MVRASLIVMAVFLGGCGTRSYYAAEPFRAPIGNTQLQTLEIEGQALPVFAGATGRGLSRQDLLRGVKWAQVVIIGETHDDAVGHATQTEIARMMAGPQSPWRLSMEMLERDDQLAADELATKTISKEEFIERTKSADWAGKGSWEKWYQPTIDAMVDNGPPLIAANAPRKYVRMGRNEGYDAMRALPEEERALFALPLKTDHEGYERRFIEWATTPMEPEPGSGATTSPHGPSSVEEARIGLRSQLIWDATMADSIARAIEADPSIRVLHLVGQFHSDFEGGTVQELRARMPDVRILTISLQPTESKTLRGEDWGRADVVIYTGVVKKEAW